MANSSLLVSSLDFDGIKSNLKLFLSTNSVFKDFNYTGSNINTELDILSYNTFMNAFLANMLASEMFLDSAQKLDTVVSHAKELNYLPRSYSSSVASITFTLDTVGISNPLIIPAGTRFSGTNSNGIFTFVTDQDTSWVSSNSTYTISNLQIYEGKYFTDTYFIDYSQNTKIYSLSNKNIDVSSLSVIVTENTVNTIFKQAVTLLGSDNTSNIFFVQASQSEQYEILFGDGLFGRLPINGAIVSAKYIVTSGTDADGITSFTVDQNLGSINGGTATLNAISVVANSSSGANQETIESIRFLAPRYYATQERAIATNDYTSLILQGFGGQIEDVSSYGGELLNPKQYGRVAVCLKPSNTSVAPNYLKNQITVFLLSRDSIPNRIIITDPDYIYCAINSIVEYDPRLTQLSPTTLQSLVLSNIIAYSDANLGKFNKDFRYSRFVAYIDTTENSIVSNETDVKLSKRISPTLNQTFSIVVNYDNPAKMSTNNSVISSSNFSYVDSLGITYQTCTFSEDKLGRIQILSKVNNIVSVANPVVGTIDYTSGTVTISNITITAIIGNYISLYMEPENKDIVATNDKVILIDPLDVTITLAQV